MRAAAITIAAAAAAVRQTADDEARGAAFRRNLERSGVVDALTRALCGLYETPEWPTDPLAVLQASVGASAALELAQLRAVRAARDRGSDAGGCAFYPTDRAAIRASAACRRPGERRAARGESPAEGVGRQSSA